ncbi:MAG: bacterio-opsin activator [Epsilonproteobacteria bacterium]|nr:bacterio-opsin activator [Campylobacterota bacterium]
MIVLADFDDKTLERLVERVFFKSIDLLGGLKHLTEYRTLTWLPSLARAAFVIVLREEYLKSEDEIAKYVGVAKSTVQKILRADPNAALYKIEHFDELDEKERKRLKVHTAGGVAKVAYKLVKDGQDSKTLLDYCHNIAIDTLKTTACDAPWAYLVLKATKGIHYPITKAKELEERIGKLDIKGVKGATIAKALAYPIKTPAQLLHEIKEFFETQGEQ